MERLGGVLTGVAGDEEAAGGVDGGMDVLRGCVAGDIDRWMDVLWGRKRQCSDGEEGDEFGEHLGSGCVSGLVACLEVCCGSFELGYCGAIYIRSC